MAPKRIIVVGANLAGLRAAETLRREGYDGELLLVSDDNHLPYDRPPLSKQVLIGALSADDTVYRPRDYFSELEIDLRLGRRASRLDLRSQRIRIGSEAVPFDGLIIATGASPRRLSAGAGVAGIHVVRTLDDARSLSAELAGGPRVVVIGAGFIGAEVAASARRLGLDVTVVEAQPTPLVRAIGTTMGQACARLHAEHGTKLLCGVGVGEIVGDRRVEGVRLSDGTFVPADVLVVGIGVVPNVDWLQGSGLRTPDGITCDATLNVGHPAVYAAGDVASWSNQLFGMRMRCEQWTNAADQGTHAARNLLAGRSAATPFISANYFWSDQYAVRIQFAGIPSAGEIKIVSGDAATSRFVAYYRRGERLVGVLAMNSPREFAAARKLIENRSHWHTALTPRRAA